MNCPGRGINRQQENVKERVNISPEQHTIAKIVIPLLCMRSYVCGLERIFRIALGDSAAGPVSQKKPFAKLGLPSPRPDLGERPLVYSWRPIRSIEIQRSTQRQ